MRVAVLGAGVIGTSVAYACLQAGHEVVLVDRPGTDWDAVRATLRRQRRLSALSDGQVPAPDLAALTCSDRIADVAGCGLVVENVTETWVAKREVYAGLRRAGVANVCVAANTSAIPIDRLAELAPDAARVIGVHFMNPVPAIDTIEVVRGRRTSAVTLVTALDFLAGMGKRTVVVEDAPGFVVNRILMVMVNQAADLTDAGVASAADIDELFKGCLRHRMGPLRTADLIGIDTVVHTLEVLLEETGEPMFTPSARLRHLVDSGRLGMKTGTGFYEYGAGGGGG